MIASKVAEEAERPFIFQLPAMSGRRAVMGSPFAASIGQGYLEERRRVDVVDRAAVHAGASVVSRTTGKHRRRRAHATKSR
jgi:hypothetical protein